MVYNPRICFSLPVDPEISAQAVYWTADSYYRAGNHDKAIQFYNKVGTMQAVPNGLKSEAKYNLGYSYWKKAEAAFKRMSGGITKQGNNVKISTGLRIGL